MAVLLDHAWDIRLPGNATTNDLDDGYNTKTLLGDVPVKKGGFTDISSLRAVACVTVMAPAICHASLLNDNTRVSLTLHEIKRRAEKALSQRQVCRNPTQTESRTL